MTSTIAPKSYVGFDTITTQIENRLIRRGFQFNIMCVGYSGLGKSTLLNTLFASHLVDSTGRKNSYEPIEKTAEIKVTSHTLKESNVTLNINAIDTPGFGDQINNDRCWEPIVRYIKDQHLQYLRKELTASREKHIQDTRVHCVLYFISPHSKRLSNLDKIVLKKLCEIANVVPVIAKSDALTLDERLNLKKSLQEEFIANGFKAYPFDSEDLIDSEKLLNDDIRSLIPFAVVGSEKEFTGANGEVVRGRKTRWGAINIEDIKQCEFVYLRDFLTRTHLQDLIESTSTVHYEGFRTQQLLALKNNASGNRLSSNTYK